MNPINAEKVTMKLKKKVELKSVDVRRKAEKISKLKQKRSDKK